ncbi:MAG: hypothetical protein H6745_18685 [Deltaproteobacteria bacterium]|nr:hypothetical protein [Deltaproteobacteria bacterium]
MTRSIRTRAGAAWLLAALALALGGAPGCGKSEEPTPGETPPTPVATGDDGALAFETLLESLTAAVTFADGTVLLIAGDQGYRYDLEANAILGSVKLPVAPDAAMRWDGDHALLFVGDSGQNLDMNTMEIVDTVSFDDLDLPPGWDFVDAAAARDADGWFLIRGDEAVVYDEDSGLVSGPYPLTEFGPREAWPAAGVTAAFGTFDGRITVLGVDMIVELDLDAETYVASPVGTKALMPDFSGLPAPFSSGVDAAASLPEGRFLLARGTQALLYSPWAAEGLAPFELGVALDAAVRWSDDAVMLFAGDQALLWDVAAGEVVGTTPLSGLGLPEAWTSVDAVALAAPGLWLVFRGAEYGVLTVLDPEAPAAAPSFSGPFALASLGWPRPRVDAAMALLDGGIALFSGDGYHLADLQAGTLTARAPFKGAGAAPAGGTDSPLAP